MATSRTTSTAINSLIGYRAFRYGKHLDLIITDQHSYRSPDPFSDDSLNKLGDWAAYDGWFPEDLQQVLDGGRAFNGGNPPAELAFGEARIPNPQKDAPPQTILGAEQKAWFKDQLQQLDRDVEDLGQFARQRSTSASTRRTCPPACSPSRGRPASSMPAATIMAAPGSERGEIYDLVRDAKITGFAIVSGDRHSFWAGYATSQLPPGKFEPVGLSFVGGSLSSAGAMEALEHRPPNKFPLRQLYLVDRPGSAKPDWTYNMLREARRPLVPRICQELRPRARAAAFEPANLRRTSNSSMLAGMAMRRFGSPATRCGPSSSASRARSRAASGPTAGPLRYRVVHTAKLWEPGERPQLAQQVLEGDPGLSI